MLQSSEQQSGQTQKQFLPSGNPSHEHLTIIMVHNTIYTRGLQPYFIWELLLKNESGWELPILFPYLNLLNNVSVQPVIHAIVKS